MKNITCLFFFNDVIYLAERLCKIIEYYVVIFTSKFCSCSNSAKMMYDALFNKHRLQFMYYK